MALVSATLTLCGAAAVRAEEPLAVWPESVESTVLQSVRCIKRPFGYTSSEMANFPGRRHCLPYVYSLFGDAKKIPVESHRIAKTMLARGYDVTLNMAFQMLGTAEWKVEEVPEAAGAIEPADEASAEVWGKLPDRVRAAVDRLVRGATVAKPHLHRAFDWNALARVAGDANVADLGSSRVYSYGAGPWLGYGSSWSFAALDSFRPAELARAGAVVSATAQEAIALLCKLDKQTKIPDFDVCRLKTPVGSVCILGPGDNSYSGRDAFVIDLGGNDRYSGRIAVPRSKAAPVGVLIDLWGEDIYDGRRSQGSIACGLFGIGALFDLAGNDQYFVRDSGLGCAWHGIGLLVDTAGDDVYSGHQWSQGAAHAGVGLLADEAGDDRYYCQLESQGLGAALGVGILMDYEGRDRYHAYDNEGGRRITFPSSQTKSHEVSLVQGAGYGRRADSTDGRSMAGGVGMLVDGAGDDSYYGGVFSQGIGFWWSLGMLVDFGGNDRYRGVYYAQGAAAHFAIGSLVDTEGNDQYNDRGILGQSLGAGRDGSIGTFLDSAGDDVYYIPKKSAGGGDMNAIGLFVDRRGDDTYRSYGYSNIGGASYGSNREYFRNFMPTIGVFADLSGKDTYPSYGNTRNNTKWFHQSSTYVTGFGIDTEAFPQPEPATEKTGKPSESEPSGKTKPTKGQGEQEPASKKGEAAESR